MSLARIISLAASGLTAQRLRMQVTSANLANMETTRTVEGGPYQRRSVVFAADPGDPTAFSSELSRAVQGVRVDSIIRDTSPPILRYLPGHPDADANGYVAYPNMSLPAEMADLLSAVRSYEANLTVLRSAKGMWQHTLSLLG
ncbi:MAG: flagellar basal body rod protein FlgC [Acidobacteriota bacterium]